MILYNKQILALLGFLSLTMWFSVFAMDESHTSLTSQESQRYGQDGFSIYLRELAKEVPAPREYVLNDSITEETNEEINKQNIKRKFSPQESYFQCDWQGCTEIFELEHKLKIHKGKQHRGSRPFKCTHEQCTYACDQVGHLNKHISAVHLKEKLYACPYCPKTFSHGHQVKRHMESCVFNKINQKSDSGKSNAPVPDPKSGIAEDAQIANSFIWDCLLCGRRFTTINGLNKHKHRAHSLFHCQHCRCTYSQRNDLIKHMQRKHSNELPVITLWDTTQTESLLSDQEQEEMDSLLNLLVGEQAQNDPIDEAIATEVDSNPVDAQYLPLDQDSTLVGLACTNNELLDNQTRQQSDHFQCDWQGCTEIFESEYKLKLHKGTQHRGSRPFKCTHEQCTYACDQVGHLNKHISAVHLKEKPYKCPFCKKVFSHKHHCKVHSIKCKEKNIYHEQEVCDALQEEQKVLRTVDQMIKNQFAVYLCDWPGCDRQFNSKNGLNVHNNRDHLNIINAFTCEKCNYSCTQKCHLQQHVRIKHENERRFECPDCHEKFAYKHHWERHIEKCTIKENIHDDTF